MKFLTMTELLALPATNEIADLLRDAANAIDCKNLEGAAWRVADACKLLRRKLKLHGHEGPALFDMPTQPGDMPGPGPGENT